MKSHLWIIFAIITFVNCNGADWTFEETEIIYKKLKAVLLFPGTWIAEFRKTHHETYHPKSSPKPAKVCLNKKSLPCTRK